MFKIKLRKPIIRKGFFKKKLTLLAQYSFLSSLILILIALILGGLIFYKYIFLIEKKEIEILKEPLSLDEATFKEILKIWQDRQKKLEETELKIKEYPNPFAPTSS